MTLAGMTAEETKQYNTEHCRRIAERLEAVASGQVWRCEECGEEFDELEGGDEWDGETCPHCGAADCFEQVGMYDWLDDALDYTFTMDSKGRMLGARVMVACGGPNIYVDTMREEVQLYWWADRADWGLSGDACDELDACLEGYFEMAKEC